MAKMSRERALREKRARKQEKKEEKKLTAAAALAAEAAGITPEGAEGDETESDPELEANESPAAD
jgi:hypothetical protein